MKRYDLGWSECDPFDGSETYRAITEQRNGDYVQWSDVEQLIAERDALRARVAELEALSVKLESDLTAAEDERGSARAEVLKLRARVAKLSAPPVVPEGWSVEWRDRMWMARDTVPGRDIQIPPAALEALAYARRTGERPPHAGDEKVRE